MSVVKKIAIKITGQVGNEFYENEYALIVAKLRVICAEYSLDLEEEI